ncbi:MAG: hypothetical protein NTU84_05850 [Verrucomicrobia bacterium]|nr:hypothetical protein [Verrucomicrobiota bacterium]
MSNELPIICKPTRWFISRALLILLMLLVFAVLFFIDGSTGYREKNMVYFLHRNFQTANEQFASMKARGGLTPESWKGHAAKQAVQFPSDHSTLPSNLKLPMPWPAILHDYDRMLPMQWNKLWLEYSGKEGLSSNPPEQPYDAGKIHEQWVVFWICIGFSTVAIFIFLRTMSRRIEGDEESVRSQQGKKISYAAMKRLDLRKWSSKGLALIDYEDGSGQGRIRIDGLTYGGFNPSQDEPAERLMKLIRSKFSGEIVDYGVASETADLPEEKPGNS